MNAFKKSFKIVAAFVLCALNGACGTSTYSDRRDNPVIHETTYGSFRISNNIVDAYATTASRRMAFLRSQRITNSDGISDDLLTFCAEPSPDVGETFSAAIAAGLEGALSLSQGTDTKLGATVAGNFGRELATQIAPLLYRTQGLQMYRDAQFGLCTDRMSGYITDYDYIHLKSDRFDKALGLIRFEIPQMIEAQKIYFAAVGAGGDKVDLDTVKKLIEAITPKQEVKQPQLPE